MFVQTLLSSFAFMALMNSQLHVSALPVNNTTDSSENNYSCLRLLEDNCLPGCVTDIPDEVKNFQVPLRTSLSKEHKECLKTCVRTNKAIFESEGCFLGNQHHNPDDDSEANDIKLAAIGQVPFAGSLVVALKSFDL
eukprot:Awhi_evm1s352